MVAEYPIHRSGGLTGRRRHRVQRRWFGAPVVVLQVERLVIVEKGVPRPVEINRYTQWRDAAPEDLMNERKPE